MIFKQFYFCPERLTSVCVCGFSSFHSPLMSGRSSGERLKRELRLGSETQRAAAERERERESGRLCAIWSTKVCDCVCVCVCVCVAEGERRERVQKSAIWFNSHESVGTTDQHHRQRKGPNFGDEAKNPWGHGSSLTAWEMKSRLQEEYFQSTRQSKWLNASNFAVANAIFSDVKWRTNDYNENIVSFTLWCRRLS
jgi:hypothetical protein